MRNGIRVALDHVSPKIKKFEHMTDCDEQLDRRQGVKQTVNLMPFLDIVPRK